VLQNGGTPLYAASSNGHAEVVGSLLAKGADVESKDNVSVMTNRRDNPTREALYKHARKTLVAAMADFVTSLIQYRALECVTKSGAYHSPVLVTNSWLNLALAIRREAALHRESYFTAGEARVMDIP
jgi:ankyrin repeat protein